MPCHAKPAPDSVASGYATLPDQALMRPLSAPGPRVSSCATTSSPSWRACERWRP